MKREPFVFLLIFYSMPWYYWLITWMKNANNLQMLKVHPQGVAKHLLDLLPISAWCCFPANSRLDEDVLKMSYVFVFRRRLQDVLIKTNIFTLVIRLQNTLS